MRKRIKKKVLGKTYKKVEPTKRKMFKEKIVTPIAVRCNMVVNGLTKYL